MEILIEIIPQKKIWNYWNSENGKPLLIELLFLCMRMFSYAFIFGNEYLVPNRGLCGMLQRLRQVPRGQSRRSYKCNYASSIWEARMLKGVSYELWMSYSLPIVLVSAIGSVRLHYRAGYQISSPFCCRLIFAVSESGFRHQFYSET